MFFERCRRRRRRLCARGSAPDMLHRACERHSLTRASELFPRSSKLYMSGGRRPGDRVAWRRRVGKGAGHTAATNDSALLYTRACVRPYAFHCH